MKRVTINTNAFLRDLKHWLKTHPHSAPAIEQTITQMIDDVMHPSLQVHKLKGKLKRYWSCSVEYDLRIIFEFIKHEGTEAILLLSLGTQDQVY